MTTKDFRLAFGTALICAGLITGIAAIGGIGAFWCIWSAWFTDDLKKHD